MTKPDVHRGVVHAFDDEDDAVIHDPRRSKAERAEHLLEAIQDYSKGGYDRLGHHWSTSEDWAKDFATGHNQARPHPDSTNVVFHAAHPEEHETYGEGDPWRDEHFVNDAEDEVSVRGGTDMEIKGVSWKRHKDKDWTRHDFDEPQWHTASLQLDISSYFGGNDGRVLRHHAGRGKPRRDGGGTGVAPGSGGGGAPQGSEAGSSGPVGAGQGEARSVEFHPQAVKDLAALDKPVQKQIHGVIESLAAGTLPPVQTHTLTKQLAGWSTTKASRGHRIVHRKTDDGGLHIGYIGLHDYGKAERRLGKRDMMQVGPYLGSLSMEMEPGDFRRVLYTSPKSQLTVMTLAPGEEIGKEVHDVDQILIVLSGRGKCLLDGNVQPFKTGEVLCVPMGTRHNVMNGPDSVMRLVTVYSPAHHAPGTVHHTKDDAEHDTQDDFVRRVGSLSREPGPVTFPYLRNTEGAPSLGSAYGQDIEPHGRYLSYHAGEKPEGDRWETGHVSFDNPLHVDFGGNYGEPSNWKHQLSSQFGGKKGKALSRAVVKAGHDGIITHDEYGPSEIVDLTHLKAKTSATLDDLAYHQRAVAEAQSAVRDQYPSMLTAIGRGQDADDALRHMLKQHGHPRHEDAFVSVHDGSRSFSSTAKDRETGAVGVVLHPSRADYGTLAHEAAHLLHDHHTGRGFREPAPDESVHGIGFIGHYAKLLEPFGKSRTPGGNRKSGGPGDLLLNTYYDSLNRNRKMGSHSRPDWADDDFTAKDGSLYHVITEPNAITMRTPEGRMGGHITWGETEGVIGNVNVMEQHQRKGLATELLRRAKEQRPDLEHSHRLSNDAQAWISGMEGKTAIKDIEPIPAYQELERPWERREYDVPDSVTEPISRGMTIPLSDEDHAYVHDRSVAPRTRAAHVLDLVSNKGADSLGMHWTTSPGMAHHFSRTEVGSMLHHPNLLSVVLHAHPPEPEHIEHDPRTLWHHGVQGTAAEGEVPLKAGAPVRIHGVEWGDSRDHTKSHSFHAGMGSKGIIRQAAHPDLHSRIFGPTYGLDHRLFEGDRMKPEVRAAVMGRLGPVLEPVLGHNWQAYVRVYMAGSEASEWTSEALEGNGDFDTLLGIDYDHARDMHLPLGGLTDADITDLVNTVLRVSYNVSPWVTDFGSFDLTGYCNANSYDITKIKPYAAYNISEDSWTVRPPHLPDWSVDKFPEGHALLEEAEGYASVIEAIDKMPEPYRTQQGKSLWKHLHGDRSRAFSDQGEGWVDPGNAVEKALNEWGLWDKLVEWQYGKQHTAAADPPTIKRGVILDGHPYKGDTEHGWDAGGWDADVAHRLVNGTATHHDILKHLDKDHVGHFWYHPDHADLGDAKEFAEPREPIHNWIDDPYDNGKVGGDVGVVMEAHHPKGWDPEKDNPVHPLEGNSYLPDNSHLKLHKLHYTTDGEQWHTIPMEHHGITLHTDGPGEQKTAVTSKGWGPPLEDGSHYVPAQPSQKIGPVYHATRQSSWPPKLGELASDTGIHFGTHQSAVERMDNSGSYTPVSGDRGPWRLFEAHLEGPVHPHHLHDEEAQEMGYTSHLPNDGRIYPYVNETEDEGSTSFVAPRRTLKHWREIPIVSQKTAASAYDPDDDDHYRSYTDWDKAYPRLPEDIHRGVAVQLPPELHDVVHDEGRPEHERAHAALQGATLKPLGMHWSSAGSEMAGNIAQDEAEQLTPRERRNTTHVVLHADRPERQHIETDIDRLVQHSVISHGRSPENEVPLKEHAPVHVWGVSWRHHDEPDWHTHEFDQPMTKMAMGARGDLPKGITYEHTHKDGIHILQARHPDMPDESKFAGLLSWWDKDGEIGSAEVHPQMQRRGLGTELFRRAKQITPHIHHSDYLTDDAKAWISGMDKTAVKSSEHEHAPDLPQEQYDALTAEPMQAYHRKTLDLAKNPVAGTHIWRGETRSGDPVQGAHESGVGMHWGVNPSNIVFPRPRSDDQQSVVYHAELEHPGEQNYTRDHPMWQGKHMSLDHEAEVRLKPGSKVKLHGVWVKDPKHPDPGYFIPRMPERMSSAWTYHPIGEHVTVAHKPKGLNIDYSDVGIGKEGSVIDITAYFKTASEDEDDTSYRMQHRPPDDDYGAPLHDLSGSGLIPADVYTHPHYYGDMSEPSVREAHHVIQRMKGKPEAKVKIYRALPAEYADQGFRPGDWVTTSKEYAVQHGRHHEDPKHDWPVISTMVHAKELHTSGDDLREYGYNGPYKERAMVSHKGGYHQEVRNNAEGRIVPVKRRAPKTSSLLDYFGATA